MKTPTEISKVTISRAITVLRESLGFRTENPFATMLHCQPGALARWERGESFPSGDWMLKLLALCPNQETYANFFLDIAESSSKIPSISRPKVPKEEEEARPGRMPAHAGIASKYARTGRKR
jgi:transcriptional regulator with XRE-family HTH domain